MHKPVSDNESKIQIYVLQAVYTILVSVTSRINIRIVNDYKDKAKADQQHFSNVNNIMDQKANNKNSTNDENLVNDKKLADNYIKADNDIEINSIVNQSEGNTNSDIDIIDKNIILEHRKRKKLLNK